jgi:hypothetical protein
MLKLSHILPPRTRNADNSKATPAAAEEYPRAVIGAAPASTALHLAIAHQLGERLEVHGGKKEEFGVDDLTMPEPLVAAAEEKIAGEYSELGNSGGLTM